MTAIYYYNGDKKTESKTLGGSNYSLKPCFRSCPRRFSAPLRVQIFHRRLTIINNHDNIKNRCLFFLTANRFTEVTKHSPKPPSGRVLAVMTDETAVSTSRHDIDKPRICLSMRGCNCASNCRGPDFSFQAEQRCEALSRSGTP